MESLEALSVTITEEMRMKICLLGDSAVGKTSLIRRFVVNKFDDKYLTTVGTKVSKKNVHIERSEKDIVLITLLIWDVLGQKEFRRLHSVFYQGAKGALIVADVTRKDTLESLPGWVESIYKINGEIPIVFLANKVDLEDKIAFSEKELKAVCAQFDAPYYFTSAKTGERVEDAFHKIAELMVYEV